MNPFHRLWQLSLFSFILAAITGFLYRYGMLYPLPEIFHFANIRHAHSHLMFFNWICPPLMILMIQHLSKNGEIKYINSFKWCLSVMIFLGLLSYPFFLFYGYQSVAIGSANLPLAAIISGLVMIAWYWFAWLYYKIEKRDSESVTHIIVDGALLTLLISSLGAWGVSIFQFTPIDSPLISSAMTHFFLSVFTEGWTVLGILGMIWAKAGSVEFKPGAGWLWMPILFGSMMIFPFSLSQSLITPAMLYTAYAGMILIIVSFSLNIYLLIKQKVLNGFMWYTVFFLAGFILLFKFAAVLPVDIWPGEHGLRVLYLHVLLLGFFSVALIELFQPKTARWIKAGFTISALLVIFSLFMISGYWPQALIPPNLFFWIMVVAGLPVIPAALLWFDTFKKSYK